MNTVQLQGRFVTEAGEPVEGFVKFIPSKIWLDEGDASYPCLAPEARLEDGYFKVLVTATDTDELPWHYKVVSPVGSHSIKVDTKGSKFLKDLLPKQLYRRS